MSALTAHRLALVGATSQVAREIKAQLARAGVPGTRIDLLDLEDHVGLVTEYGDEARVVLEAAEAPLRRAGLACFCGSRETARRLAPVVVDSGGVAIDCTGALAHHPRAVTPGAASTGPRLIVVPHPAAVLLAVLAVGVDLDAVAATVLLPASEGHERGPDEMAKEATDLLNFGSVDAAADASRRTAFDLWVDEPARERIVADLRRAGLKAPRMSVLRASVFHGLSATLFIHGVDADGLRTALVATDATVGDGAVDSPARAAGSAGVHVAGLRTDGGGSWLWAVADNYGLVAAAAVAEIIATLEPGDETVS